jgi:hypothetical protein
MHFLDWGIAGLCPWDLLLKDGGHASKLLQTAVVALALSTLVVAIALVSVPEVSLAG